MTATITEDFGDWMNPMLVKEFRQGLSSRAFVTSFLFLQTLMVCSMVLILITYAGTARTSETTAIFWVINGMVFLIAMPARGLVALSSEMNGNMIELLYFTRLTPEWIVMGKWLAIVAQTSLAACSVLPYTVLRYFVGGINMVDEIQGLFLLVMISAVVTGTTVAGSAFRSPVLRLVGLAFSIFVLFVGLAIFFGVTDEQHFPGALIFVTVLGTFVLLVMFVITLVRIGPPTPPPVYEY